MAILPLATHGVSASRLVLGCMPFGGSWDSTPITRENMLKAEAAVEAALAIGINMFDHADIYTRGKSEEIFGTILKNRPALREQIIVQTKCGIRFPDDATPIVRYDFSREYILAAVDSSLRRLGVEFIDILLLHRPDALMEPTEVADAFATLKAGGKVRYFGVSNMNASQMRSLQRELPEPLVANQLELSLARLDWVDQGVHVNQKAGLNTNFDSNLLDYCQSERVQIQSWGPLAQGSFSGRSLEGKPENVAKTAALVSELAAAKETTPEAIVLGWLMRHPAMIQPIIGTNNPQRIAACQDAERQAAEMSRDEWYRLYVSARGAAMP